MFKKAEIFIIIGIIGLSFCIESQRPSIEDIFLESKSEYFKCHSNDLDRKKREAIPKRELSTEASSLNATASANSTSDLEAEASGPVAEKFISLFGRKPGPEDIRRERMKGLIFTGKSQLLGPMSRAVSSHRRRMRPYQRRKHFNPNVLMGSKFLDDPPEILKPYPFTPSETNVEFPIPFDEKRVSNIVNEASQKTFSKRPIRGHHFERQPTIRNSRFHPRPKSVLNLGSNNIGPDFGQVTFEDYVHPNSGHFEHDPSTHENHDHFVRNQHDDFAHNIQDHFLHSEQHHDQSLRNGHEIEHYSSDDHNGAGNNFGFSHANFGKFEKFPPFKGVGGSRNNDDGCERYTEDICLDTNFYPHEQILTSLARDSQASSTLVADMKDQSADDLVDGVSSRQESRYDYQHYFGNRRIGSSGNDHRDFANEGGYLCPSEIKYAKPRRGRSSKGRWKFIVNMDKYSQTLRMEKCLKPGGSCSYVSHHYRAVCNQVYNYHRLLSWTKKDGLHMDIYKVPSCCTCHIQGYAFTFPPLNKNVNNKISRISESGKIETIVPPQDATQHGINKLAPPYSPVNYPNVPSKRNRRVRPGFRRPAKPKRRNKQIQSYNRNRATEKSVHPAKDVAESRLMETESKINYGYHPIIDFFEET